MLEILSEFALKTNSAPENYKVAVDKLSNFTFLKHFTQTSINNDLDDMTQLLEKYATEYEYTSGSPVKLEEFKKIAEHLPANPNEDNSTKEESNINKKPKYRSLGQMVKANDFEELKKTIEAIKETSGWGEQNIETSNKLLLAALSLGALESVKVLIETGDASIDIRDDNGFSPILMACSSNKPDVVDFLLKKGANISDVSVDGMTALIVAAISDADQVIEYLINKAGIDINEMSLDGRTALHMAAIGNEETTSAKAIETLISLGADPTIKEAMSDAYAEEYIDQEHDDTYALLSQYRSDWEAGKKGPITNKSKIVSKARSVLGF